MGGMGEGERGTPGGMEKGVKPEQPAKPISTPALYIPGPVTPSNRGIGDKKQGEHKKTHIRLPIRRNVTNTATLFSLGACRVSPAV